MPVAIAEDLAEGLANFYQAEAVPEIDPKQAAGGCEYVLSGLAKERCGVWVVYVVSYRYDQYPILCCPQHLPEAVDHKMNNMSESIFDPGRVLVSLFNDFANDGETKV